MISIGLTTWSDHPSLIKQEQRPVQLPEYAAVFPVVEIDTTFYGIPSELSIQNWLKQVPSEFKFIVKANREMTLHPNIDHEISTIQREQVFAEFVEKIKIIADTEQLSTILFQFPPTFNATHDNVKYLQLLRSKMGSLPISVEFRNMTWFDQAIFPGMTDLFTELNYDLVAVDEPTGLTNSAPLILNSKTKFVRLHGRNKAGWQASGTQWRKERTNYRYSKEELQSIADLIKTVTTGNVTIIFNNNGGHAAADNAIELKDMFGITFENLAPHQPEQLDLF